METLFSNLGENSTDNTIYTPFPSLPFKVGVVSHADLLLSQAILACLAQWIERALCSVNREGQGSIPLIPGQA